MDKVLIHSNDVQTLFKWRDEHKKEVQSNPTPVRNLEIICQESGIRMKCIREGQELKLWVNIDGRSQGHIEFRLLDGGMWAEKKNKTNLNKEEIQSCLTLYASIVALMVYGEKANTDIKERRSQNDETGRSNGKKKKQKGGYTYILRHRGVSVYVGGHGTHASPKGEFSVRGHYRHYKSGKTVWINEYQKGTGKRKGKKYRIGKEDLPQQ